jgi:uncharacterized membrane protein YfcA
VNGLATFLWLALGTAAMVALFTGRTVTYRFSTKPIPNQRLARIAFLVMGIGFFLGGLISLWIDWQFRR